MLAEITDFLVTRVPDEWFVGPVVVQVDEDEILCVGTLHPDRAAEPFREQTRPSRMAIAREAEARFGRSVTWGVVRDGITTVFTSRRVPVSTRLEFGERAVLDTLIEAGVARSRSEAVSWCIKLVGRHEADWLAELREALVGVEHVRATGPTRL